MPSRNTFFKPSFTEQERDECMAWFEAHMDELPQGMLIDKSIATNDLKQTVSSMIAVLRNQNVTRRSTYCGYMSILLRIRAMVEQNIHNS